MNDNLPLAELHTKVMTTPIVQEVGDELHDEFYRLLATYRNYTTPDRYHELAVTCERRLIRTVGALPLDLISAYHRLARLARWRAKQLEERNV